MDNSICRMCYCIDLSLLSCNYPSHDVMFIVEIVQLNFFALVFDVPGHNCSRDSPSRSFISHYKIGIEFVTDVSCRGKRGGVNDGLTVYRFNLMVSNLNQYCL